MGREFVDVNAALKRSSLLVVKNKLGRLAEFRLLEICEKYAGRKEYCNRGS